MKTRSIISSEPTPPVSLAQRKVQLLGRGAVADLLFWLIYGLLNHIVFAPNRFTPGNLLVSAILLAAQAGGTYAHLRYLLIPRLEDRLSLLPYVGGLVLIMLIFPMLTLVVLFVVLDYGLPLGLGLSDLADFAAAWSAPVLGGFSLTLAVTSGIYLFGRHRDQRNREVALKSAKQDAELAVLRGQLNPHFLFNALNSIYVLIPRDPDAAQSALSGFSDLLRYQLYQSESPLVPISDELDNLERFAELNRLRLEEDFSYRFDAPDQATGQIPPMLLQPLLENAFKYSPTLNGYVVGEAKIIDDRLHFTLRNRIAKSVTSDPNAGGIGLKNIRQRLALIYQGQHTFETSTDGDFYCVILEIPLR